MNDKLPMQNVGGGNPPYLPPVIETIEIVTEKGFAQSDRPDNDYGSNDNGNY